MLLIYSPNNSPRLNYILDLVFCDLVGVNYQLTNEVNEFHRSPGPKLAYTDEPLEHDLIIQPSPLLFEKGIRKQDISVFDFADSKAFFATHPRFAFPFDLLAASFYLVTRYEEYLPHKRDHLDRYSVTESLAWQKGFLQRPLVNIWAKLLREKLARKYPDLQFRRHPYKYVSTIDIDNAFAYKEKGFIRTAGACARHLLNLEWQPLYHRLSTVAGRSHDPYDTYQYLSEIGSKYNLNQIYFFLLADYGENDKNVPFHSRKFQSLIKHLSDYHPCGIHPSFASNSDTKKVAIEKSRLKKITRREITLSRQHFLVLKFPDTYRLLIDNDITDDYTMGHAADVGFRASICTSFFFYDLRNEFRTKLRIHPFAIMDATFRHYLKVKPEEVINLVRPLVREVKAADGTFISLWHNESLSNHPPWNGWKHVYEEVIKEAL